MDNNVKPRINKIIKTVLIVIGVLAILFVALCFFLGLTDDEPVNPDNPVVTGIPANNLGIPSVNNVAVENSDKVIYDNGDLKLSIEPAGDENLEAAGTTRDGKAWKKDGDAIVVDGKKVTVLNNSANKDAGKIAAVASALSSKRGYTKGVDDYNHNYAIYYMEAADCLLYYPKQLTLVSEGEDQSLIFRDSRSNAELKVTLSENEYACMDDVENIIATSAYTAVLASGTDWFSAETYGKSTTTFSLTGLGNKYSVTAELTYEKKYNFVFEELRKLLKCRFIGKGVWVSNAKANTVGKKVAAVEKPASAYDPVLKRTSYHSKKLNCVVAYPDVFTKQYEDDESLFFTDPVTGAYVEVKRLAADITIGEFQSLLEAQESNLVNDHSLRASNGDEIMFATIRDGYIWSAVMSYPSEYSGIYSYAYDMLEICIEGDDVNTTEMQQIYFPAFNCYVVIPVQYEEYGTDGDVHLIRDSITGMEARLSFTKVTDPADYNNLYSVFKVVAEDENVMLCEDQVKWHNIDGLFLGAAGREYAALLELSYPNAYAVYESCWKDFGIYFFTGEELVTDAEEIRKEATATVVLEAAKEEVISENDTQTEVFARADTATAKKDSNVSEKLKDNGKKQGASKETSGASQAEPNRVLVYKTLNDYMDVVTSGEEWLTIFPEIFPRPADTKRARYYVVLYSMNVLAYNGYTIPNYASDVEAVAEIVDEYVRALSDCGERIDTQLGEGVISVFEVLCYYLGIDEVPKYVIEELENFGNSVDKPTPVPTKTPEPTKSPEPTRTPEPTAAPVPTEGLSDVSGNVYPQDAEKTFAELPFNDIPNLDREQSVYGSLTNLCYELDNEAYTMLKEAVEELYNLNFSCVYEDVSGWCEEYAFAGYLPGTDMEMLIYVIIYSDEVEIMWMLEDGEVFDQQGTLSFYGIDYSLESLTDLSQLNYFMYSVYDYEEAFGDSLQFRLTKGEFDMNEEPFADMVQDGYEESEDRSCYVIESGYYGANGDFTAVHTYVYLDIEGFTICLE